MIEFNNNKPIYIQIIEHLKIKIVSGELNAGCKIASVRDLALDAGVNPNTMQRALGELEREGLLISQRTTGRFVTDDLNLINQLRKQLATDYVGQILCSIKNMGFSKIELLSIIQELIKEMN